MLLTSQRPGVHVFESTFGPIPIELAAYNNVYLVGPALRGPLTPVLVTTPTGFHKVYGRRSSATYLDEAIRAVFEIVQAKIWVQRVVGAGSAVAVKNLGIFQVETATVAGAITGSGNITAIITAVGMTGTPKTLNIAVLNGDSAAVVAGKIRTALAADVDVAALFAVSGTGVSVILTRLAVAANDGTINIALATGTATGLTAAPTSADTTPGSANIIAFTAKGPGADYNYSAGPPKAGVAVTYDKTKQILRVYDYSDPNDPTAVKEIFYDFTYTNSAAKVQEVNNTSNLINIAWTDPTKDPDTISTDQGLASGANGSTVSNSDMVGDESASPKTGVAAFLGTDYEPGVLLAPGYSDVTVGLQMISIGSRSRKLPFIDSTFGNGANAQTLITEKQQYANDKGYGVFCAQWVKALDLDTNVIKDIPRSPFAAAHLLASHNQPGSFANVGAGVKYVYPNVVALEYDFNDLDHDELNRNNVNIARNFSRKNRGIVSFSARTISGNVLYRFVSVRVIFDVMEQSIERALLDYVFEPIDGENKLANKIKAAISQFLHTLWQEGVLFGTVAADAYLVIPQTSNQALLDQGILGFDIYAKPTPPAERIVANFYRTALTVNLIDKTVSTVDKGAA